MLLVHKGSSQTFCKKTKHLWQATVGLYKLLGKKIIKTIIEWYCQLIFLMILIYKQFTTPQIQLNLLFNIV